MVEPELVIRLNPDGEPVGTSPKADIHGPDTPFHLAFSCYLIGEDGRLLMTRRALTKQAWPGVWTNSFCGHPAPGEDMGEAISRRAKQELNALISDIQCQLPDFRYRAIDAAGTVENELCPVFTATVRGNVRPDPSEAVEWSWVDLNDLVVSITATPFAFSPWLCAQLPLLVDAGILSDGHSHE